jgi:hypothetical protein
MKELPAGHGRLTMSKQEAADQWMRKNQTD